MKKHISKFRNLTLFYLLALFIKIVGIMVLILWEWFLTANNITSIMLSQVIPITYSVGLVSIIIYVWYMAYKIEVGSNNEKNI